jgi:hypothetical protein
LAAYGYIYNTLAETVAQEASITFGSNGPLVGITHTPGRPDVVVTSSGTYAIDFLVTTSQASQFALFVNGAVVPQSIYGSSGAGQKDGQVIVALTAGDVLTLVNHTSNSGSVSLSNTAGGSQTNVDASLLIEKLA